MLTHALRLKRQSKTSVAYPTQPHNPLEQVIATSSAIMREASGPEYHIRNRYLTWLSPPPLGRCLVVLVYWAVITYMLCHESIVSGAYYFEKIGFRAAWVSITQVPLIYLLATKFSFLGFLTATSHERLNWLHRWVSRTLLITATVHGAFFYAQWDRVDYVQIELDMMPMVKYGMGAWFILLWTALSSLMPLRSWCYELFVLQHLAAAAVFLWCLWMHVPDYAFYNIWFAIAAVCVDKVIMWGWTAWCNLSLPKKGSKNGVQRASQMFGHRGEIKVLNDKLTEVLIHDVSFKWNVGQHVYLRIPSLSLKSNPFEAHPFTIANAPRLSSRQTVQLLVEKKGGFTKHLHTAAAKYPGGASPVTAIITGPLGNPPTWPSYETLVLISASTGISFTLPILESIIDTSNCQAVPNAAKEGCVRRIDFLQVVKSKHSTKAYLTRLENALLKAEQAGVELRIRIAVTCERCGCCGANCQCHNFDAQPNTQTLVAERPFRSRVESSLEKDTISILDSDDYASSSMDKKLETDVTELSGSQLTTPAALHTVISATTSPMLKPVSRPMGQVLWTSNRPDIADYIRSPVEATGGETIVAVCGGKSLVACVRNSVARLSDERGVHKGTGAQGISIWSEHYCF